MSIVGPRPLPNYQKLNDYNDHIEKRLEVLPGLTGLAQISYTGKKRTYVEKFNLDIMYVNNRSIFMYFKIIFLTFRILFIRFLNNKNAKTL